MICGSLSKALGRLLLAGMTSGENFHTLRCETKLNFVSKAIGKVLAQHYVIAKVLAPNDINLSQKKL